MRLTRLVIGFFVILIAGFIIIGEQLSGTSSDAVINARLTTLQAPVAGTVEMDRRPLGSMVEENERLGTIENSRVDDVRLNDLRRERAFAAAEVERLSATIDEIETALEGLRLRAETYRDERVRQLQRQVEAARSRQAAAEARLSEQRAALRRSQELNQRGIETAASMESNQAAVRVAELEVDDALQQLAERAILLDSARRGTFLGDGTGDAPFSEQRIQDLSLRRGETQAGLEAEKARAAALDRRIEAEQLRVNRLKSAEIISNVDGHVWEILADSGETIQQGQPLINLVDCRTTLVTLSVAENIYNRLKIGDEAAFRMRGGGELFPGSVTRLAGSGASTIYRNLAVAPSQKHLERFDVTLLVPAMREHPELGCAIGRTGRVFFQSRPLDMLRRLWR